MEFLTEERHYSHTQTLSIGYPHEHLGIKYEAKKKTVVKVEVNPSEGYVFQFRPFKSVTSRGSPQLGPIWSHHIDRKRRFQVRKPISCQAIGSMFASHQPGYLFTVKGPLGKRLSRVLMMFQLFQFRKPGWKSCRSPTVPQTKSPEVKKMKLMQRTASSSPRRLNTCVQP